LPRSHFGKWHSRGAAGAPKLGGVAWRARFAARRRAQIRPSRTPARRPIHRSRRECRRHGRAAGAVNCGGGVAVCPDRARPTRPARDGIRVRPRLALRARPFVEMLLVCPDGAGRARARRGVVRSVPQATEGGLAVCDSSGADVGHAQVGALRCSVCGLGCGV